MQFLSFIQLEEVNGERINQPIFGNSKEELRSHIEETMRDLFNTELYSKVECQELGIINTKGDIENLNFIKGWKSEIRVLLKDLTNLQSLVSSINLRSNNLDIEPLAISNNIVEVEKYLRSLLAYESFLD